MNVPKLVFVLVALAVIVAVGIFATQDQAVATAVQVPEKINVFIGVATLAVVTAGFKYLFLWVGLDLSQFATPLAGTISLYLVAEVQGYINLLSNTYPQYDPVISFTLNVIVLLLGAIGSLYIIAKQRAHVVMAEGNLPQLL